MKSIKHTMLAILLCIILISGILLIFFAETSTILAQIEDETEKINVLAPLFTLPLVITSSVAAVLLSLTAFGFMQRSYRGTVLKILNVIVVAVCTFELLSYAVIMLQDAVENVLVNQDGLLWLHYGECLLCWMACVALALVCKLVGLITRIVRFFVHRHREKVAKNVLILE